MLKKMIKTKKKMVLSLAAMMVMSFTGCSNNQVESESSTTASEASTTTSETNTTTTESNSTDASTDSSTEATITESGDEAASEVSELEIRFGEGSETFILRLDDNETAAEIANDVGSADWNLPIYHFDDFDDSDVMQYYDISSRYTIPSNPETITSEKAGEVYYSDPNRIILFYQDAEVTGEYTKVGNIDNLDGLYDAVVNNPVIEGWGNKIVSISSSK